MTNTGFPNHEDRALPRWISASVLVAASMVVMIGLLTVTSGASVRNDLAAAGAAASTAIDHAVGRSGTLMAYQIAY